MDPIAVTLVRGTTVESVHRAAIAVARPDGTLVASFGRPGLVSFMRSSAKPMQTTVLLESGAADRFRFGEPEIAIATGSHNGEPRHTELVARMLETIGLGPDALRCGRHPPYGKDAALAIGEKYSALHSNCSGKHAGMLAACVHRGWDVDSYLSADHPLQKAILRAVAEETGVRVEGIPRGTDGCGVPTFAVPVRSAARAYARLADPSDVPGERRSTLVRIRDAMRNQPFLLAGSDRLDTDFAVAAKRNLIVKAGAEAFYCAALVKQGFGIALKIEDGATRAIPAALVGTLKGLGAATRPFLAATKKHWDEPLKNIAGRVVGRYESSVRLRRPGLRKGAA